MHTSILETLDNTIEKVNASKEVTTNDFDTAANISKTAGGVNKSIARQKEIAFDTKEMVINVRINTI